MSDEERRDLLNNQENEATKNKNIYARLLCIVSADLVATIILELMINIRVARHTMNGTQIIAPTIALLVLRELVYFIASMGDYERTLNFRRYFWKFYGFWNHNFAILWLITVGLFLTPAIFIINVYYLSWFPVLSCLRDIIEYKDIPWAEGFRYNLSQKSEAIKKNLRNSLHNTKSGAKEIGNAYASVFGRKTQAKRNENEENKDECNN